MRIVLTGGGTGGHVTPLIAVARELERMASRGEIPPLEAGDPALEMLYLGVVTALDRAALAEAGIPFRHIPSGKIRRYLAGVHLTLLDLLFRVPLGILRAAFVLFFVMPDVVFSKGGYGSLPVVFVSWLYRIPVLLHETDIVPGLANRNLARYASAVVVAFREAERYFPSAKVSVSGTPLRPSFQAFPPVTEARARLKLHDRKPVIFVTGGSQGSQRINSVVLASLPKLLPETQVLHQVGANNYDAVRSFVTTDLRHVPEIADYRFVASVSEADMVASLAAADLVVSRAGGTALAEIAAAGKPSLLIPLRESAQDHQWENAYFFRERGAAVVLDEQNLTSSLFELTIRRMLETPVDLRLMAERVQALHRPTAAGDIAATLLAMVQGRVPRRVVAHAESRVQSREL